MPERLAVSEHVDVLVVGAGPTGLFLANELVRRGLQVRIIDCAAEPSRLSRAIVVHARTLEVLAESDLADPLIARGLPLAGLCLRAGSELLMETRFDKLPSAFPFVLSVSQADTEAVLTERLQSAGVEVERATQLDHFRQHGTGVSAVVDGPAGRELLRAAWMVGCDGAHSAVRHGMNLAFEGQSYEEHLVLADVALELQSADVPRIQTWLAPDGICALFPLIGGRTRIIATAPAGLSEDPTLDDIQTLVDQRTNLRVTLSQMSWLSRFRIHCRQVSTYQDDRVLLAGDAAHIHSPVGGQGMNTGLQDAHNLAWKLVMVHGGAARLALLSTYTEERHRIGAEVLHDTDVATRILGLKHPVARALRDQAVSLLSSFTLLRERVTRQLAELDVSYDGGPLTFGDGSYGVGARIPDGPPHAAAQFTLLVPHPEHAPHTELLPGHLASGPWAPLFVGIYERYSDTVVLRAGGVGDRASLIRPDGYLAASFTSDEAQSFLIWLARWLR